MKKSIILVGVACFLTLAMLFSFGVLSKAFAGQVTLAWDANSPNPDGYLMFQRDNDAQPTYIYTSPVIVNGVTNAQGDIPPAVTQMTITGLGVNGKDITYYYVVRAFLDKQSGREQSGDSNEVFIQFDYRLPTIAANLVVTYDESSGNITAVWEQSSPDIVDNWKIYTSDVSGGPYTLLDTVQNTGQAQPTTTKSVSVPDGTKKTIYFVVVTFRSDTLYSANSAEASVVVDKRTVEPPVLRVVQVTIPVTN